MNIRRSMTEMRPETKYIFLTISHNVTMGHFGSTPEGSSGDSEGHTSELSQAGDSKTRVIILIYTLNLWRFYTLISHWLRGRVRKVPRCFDFLWSRQIRPQQPGRQSSAKGTPARVISVGVNTLWKQACEPGKRSKGMWAEPSNVCYGALSTLGCNGLLTACSPLPDTMRQWAPCCQGLCFHHGQSST